MTLSALNSETIFRTERSLIAQTCLRLYITYTVFKSFIPAILTESLLGTLLIFLEFVGGHRE